GNAVWQPSPPARVTRRDTLSSAHRESGTLWMGEKVDTSVTDEAGRIWELDNVYVVGPAVLPTMGSPNPMPSGVALSRRTAERLISPPSIAKVDAGFEYLFDGTERTFQRWRSAGPGSFVLVDGMLIAQPGRPSKVDGVTVPVGAHSVFYYAAEAFNDFTLRLQFRLSGPIGSTGRPIDNSAMPRIRKARTCPPTAIQRCSRMSLTTRRGLPPTPGSRPRSTRMPRPTVPTSTEPAPSTTCRRVLVDCRTSRQPRSSMWVTGTISRSP